MGARGLVFIVGFALGCGTSQGASDEVAGAGGSAGHAGNGGEFATGGSAGREGTGGSGGDAAGSGGDASGSGGDAGGGSGGAAGSGASAGRSGSAGASGAPAMPGPTGTWVTATGPFDEGGGAPAIVKLADGTVLMLGVGMQAFRYSRIETRSRRRRGRRACS